MIYPKITKKNVSESWVRKISSYSKTPHTTFKRIMRLRYGKKICIASLDDLYSIDEALTRGYNILLPSELSSGEKRNIKEKKPIFIKTSSELFNTAESDSFRIIAYLTEDQELFAKYAKKIAKQFLEIDLRVLFIRTKREFAFAYGDEILTVNLDKVDEKFFSNPVTAKTTDVILHELAHEAGYHCDKKYQRLITKLAGELVIMALENPEFFKIQ